MWCRELDDGVMRIYDSAVTPMLRYRRKGMHFSNIYNFIANLSSISVMVLPLPGALSISCGEKKEENDVIDALLKLGVPRQYIKRESDLHLCIDCMTKVDADNFLTEIVSPSSIKPEVKAIMLINNNWHSPQLRTGVIEPSDLPGIENFYKTAIKKLIAEKVGEENVENIAQKFKLDEMLFSHTEGLESFIVFETDPFNLFIKAYESNQLLEPLASKESKVAPLEFPETENKVTSPVVPTAAGRKSMFSPSTPSPEELKKTSAKEEQGPALPVPGKGKFKTE